MRKLMSDPIFSICRKCHRRLLEYLDVSENIPMYIPLCPVLICVIEVICFKSGASSSLSNEIGSIDLTNL